MHNEKTTQVATRSSGTWCGWLGVSVLVLSGCSHMSTTDKGVLAGGALGAGTGALIGNSVGHTGAGALIGAGLGAVTGGITGGAVENAERKEAALAAAHARGPVGLTDVVSMTLQGVSDDVIVGQIHSSGSVFQLSPSDTVYLTQNRVSDRVIRAMQETTRRPRVVAPVYQPVYVVEPPPPPVRVGFGVGFCR